MARCGIVRLLNRLRYCDLAADAGRVLHKLRGSGELNLPKLIDDWASFDLAIADGDYGRGFRQFEETVSSWAVIEHAALVPIRRKRLPDGSGASVSRPRFRQRFIAAVLFREWRKLCMVLPEGDSARKQTAIDDWNKLTDRQRDCLRVLAEARAFDVDSRLRADDIVVKAEGRGANVNGFKLPLSELVLRGLVTSKTGREGGYWLTAEGRSLAEKTRSTTDSVCA